MTVLRRSFFALSRAQVAPIRRITPLAPYRFNSSFDAAPKRYSFEDIKQFTANPSPHRIIIDVREPGEFEGGAIPGAINLPIGSSPEALMLPEEEFQDRFGIPKPDKKENEVVFYCKAGIRSHSAAELAKQAGYEKVAEYPGSWVDWIKKKQEEGN